MVTNEPVRSKIAALFFVSIIILAIISSPFLAFVGLKSLDVDMQPLPHTDAVQQDGEQQEPQPSTSHNAKSSSTPWFKNAESRPYLMLTRMAVLSAAALFGVLGATLSVLTRTDSMPITTQQLVGLQLVGAVFALMLALIFAGGFIQGSLFPAGFGSWFGVIYRHEEFAKLLVWSFIAGFSERAVPQILRTFTERLQGVVEEHRTTDESKPSSDSN